MNVELLKAGFILSASAAFIIVTFGHKLKIRKIKKALPKESTEEENLFI